MERSLGNGEIGTHTLERRTLDSWMVGEGKGSQLKTPRPRGSADFCRLCVSREAVGKYRGVLWVGWPIVLNINQDPGPDGQKCETITKINAGMPKRVEHSSESRSAKPILRNVRRSQGRHSQSCEILSKSKWA